MATSQDGGKKKKHVSKYNDAIRQRNKKRNKHARRQPSIGKFHNYTGMTNSGAVSVGRNASHLGRGITHGTASGSSSRTVNTRCAIARAFTGQRSIGG